ncbi:MAG: hypothetical protein WBD79_05360 [Anaerolineae bacterium]|nr:hypothetical protein [Anaerolineae bacterium]
MWFERLTDFPEVSPHQVREKIAVDGKMLISHVNGRAMVHGQLETPTLGELRERVHASGYQSGKMSVREIVANVQQLHTEVANAGALFQVASQFNLLEMVSPDVTPERGVGIYDHDHTQGPACAIAAGAGTIYRNYFAMVNGQIGQSASNQIDCLADVGAALGNTAGRLWEMRNGYALASQRGLAEITHRLQASSERELDELRQLLRIGLQWNTQVTLDKAKHTVSQAYCSALPVTYSTHPAPLWAAFARLILEAAYEATICAGILNALSSGNKSVFLTLLGGGAFGNTTEWIMSAIQRALNLNRYADLDVAIVSYGASNPQVQQLLHQWS